MKYAALPLIMATILLSACDLSGRLSGGTVTVTNVIVVPGGTNTLRATNITVVINPVTNTAVITNILVVSNSNYVVTGSLTLTNTFNEGQVQPTFRLSGTLDAALASITTNFTVRITNTGYITNAFLTNGSWSATVLTQRISYASVEVSADFGTFGSFTLFLNLRVTNLPLLSIPVLPDGLSTNALSVGFSGFAYSTIPDSISQVVVYQESATGQKTTNLCSLAIMSAWEPGTVTNVLFSKTLSLFAGQNAFTGAVISRNGFITALPPFTVTRSLMAVDGVKESGWLTTPLVGTSGAAGYNGYSLGELRVTNDAEAYYFYLDAGNVPDLGNGGARVSIAIDTNSAAGLTNDAWGGTFTFAMPLLPDYQLEIRLNASNNTAAPINGAAFYMATNSGWTALSWSWDGGTHLNGCRYAVRHGQGFEMAVPRGLMPAAPGAQLMFTAVLSGSDGSDGNLQCWDVVPEFISNISLTNIFSNISGTTTNVSTNITIKNAGNPEAVSENDFGQVLRMSAGPYIVQ